MPGRVGVDPEPLVVDSPQGTGTQCEDFCFARCDVVDPQVDVQLLGRAVRPLRRLVVGSELHSHEWLIGDPDAVPVLGLLHPPAGQGCPKRALGFDVRCVEHDDGVLDVHAAIFPDAGASDLLTAGATIIGPRRRA